MNKNKIINKTEKFVKKTLKNSGSSHDWQHIERVRKNTFLLLKTEKANPFVCELAALLHDIADHKYHGGDENMGAKKTRKFLKSLNLDEKTVAEVVNIVKNISWLGGHNENRYFSNELAVVQDADRLDAIGAIGIARAFAYGGEKNREIYNPEIKPDLNMSKEEYKNSKSPTINHFYEKLLRLKNKMNTKSGKKEAEKRHNFMLLYLKQFFDETGLENQQRL